MAFFKYSGILFEIRRTLLHNFFSKSTRDLHVNFNFHVNIKIMSHFLFTPISREIEIKCVKYTHCISIFFQIFNTTLVNFMWFKTWNVKIQQLSYLPLLAFSTIWICQLVLWIAKGLFTKTTTIVGTRNSYLLFAKMQLIEIASNDWSLD